MYLWARGRFVTGKGIGSKQCLCTILMSLRSAGHPVALSHEHCPAWSSQNFISTLVMSTSAIAVAAAAVAVAVAVAVAAAVVVAVAVAVAAAAAAAVAAVAVVVVVVVVVVGADVT